MYSSQQKFIILFLKIVTPILILVALSSYFFLKKIEDNKKALMYEKVQSMASLIHSVYNFDAKYSLEVDFSFDPNSATLSQVQNTFNELKDYEGISLKYFLGTKNGQYIEYLAYSTQEKPPNVLISDSMNAQPMRDALEGFSTVNVKRDFEGKKVFSAFTNIIGTPWALVIEQSYEDHISPIKEIAFSVAILSLLVLISLYFVLSYFEKKNNALIKNSEDRFRHMVESTSDLVWEIDTQAKFTYLSYQIKYLLGYSYAEALGKTPFHFMKEEEAIRVSSIFKDLVDKKECLVDIESINISKSGEEVIVLTNGTPFYNSFGDMLGYRGVSKNITTAKRHKEQMKQLAYFDTLTGLANRKNILSRVEEEIGYALRNKTSAAVIYLDLDGFKQINDSLGHDYGDEVLKIVACRLQECVREFDVVGRVGGDEFIILIRAQEKECKNCKEQIIMLMDRLKKSINRPIVLNEEEYSVGASIGVAFVPKDAQGAYEIIKKADSAMYKAKKSGRNCAIFYDNALQEEVDKSQNFKAELNKALAKNEFKMFYQAQYNLNGDKVLGYEALIRWKHPRKGLLEATEFMPYIDKFGLSLEVDKYVCNSVYDDLFELSQEYPSFHVSINISSKSLVEDSFITFAEDKVYNYGVDASKITLEITEGALLNFVNNSYLSRIVELGFSISIDDFGTGCSNLSYLSMIKYHEIKLDKTFVQGISKSEKDKKVCKFILHMCKELNVRVVAEGVETKEQLSFLKEAGVDVIQGYLFSVPHSLEEIKSSLK